MVGVVIPHNCLKAVIVFHSLLKIYEAQLCSLSCGKTFFGRGTDPHAMRRKYRVSTGRSKVRLS